MPHGELHEKASLFAHEYGVRATGSIVEGQDGSSLLEANCGLSLEKADLKRAIGQMPQ
jgi:hypothetical protein